MSAVVTEAKDSGDIKRDVHGPATYGHYSCAAVTNDSFSQERSAPSALLPVAAIFRAATSGAAVTE